MNNYCKMSLFRFVEIVRNTGYASNLGQNMCLIEFEKIVSLQKQM